MSGVAPSTRRSNEPFFWALFSSGGMLAALVMPALCLVLWLAIPLGWIEAPSQSTLAVAFAHPLARVAIWVLVSLSMFHWAHRFRFTLYDGLQLYHLAPLIAVICYGGATAVTLAAALVLW